MSCRYVEEEGKVPYCTYQCNGCMYNEPDEEERFEFPEGFFQKERPSVQPKK